MIREHRSAVSAVVLSLLMVGSLPAMAGVGVASGNGPLTVGDQSTAETSGVEVAQVNQTNDTAAREPSIPLTGRGEGDTDSVTADREPPDDGLAVVHSQAPSANTSVALTRVLAQTGESALDFKVEFSSGENDTYSSTTIPIDADQDPSTGLTESDGFTGITLLPDAGIGADYIISQGADAGSKVFEFDPRSVNRTTTGEIRLDSTGTLPSGAVERPRKRVALGQPELTIGSSVRYLDTRDGLVAEVPVRNRGPVAANLTLSAVAPETNETVGERSRRVSPAIGGVGVGTEFLLPLDGVADGDPIQFVLESADSQTVVGTTVTEDRVGPTLDGDLGPAPVVGQNAPRDLNGDGQYRDVDGSGEFDIFDVQAFFDSLDSDVVQNNPAAFNFDGSDNPTEVTIFDVQALFAALQAENT